eukprot:s568_g6.t1
MLLCRLRPAALGRREVSQQPEVRNAVAEMLLRLERGVRDAIFSTVAAARAAGFHVQVCRHDLFHGHLFRGENGEVGILLHACEYPSQNDDFPVNLGFCQADTQVKYEDAVMQHRNILLLFSRPLRAFVLDAESDCVKALIPEYARKPMYTLYEDTLGEPLADMYFLSSEKKLGWVQRRSSKVHLPPTWVRDLGAAGATLTGGCLLPRDKAHGTAVIAAAQANQVEERFARQSAPADSSLDPGHSVELSLRTATTAVSSQLLADVNDDLPTIFHWFVDVAAWSIRARKVSKRLAVLRHLELLAASTGAVAWLMGYWSSWSPRTGSLHSWTDFKDFLEDEGNILPVAGAACILFYHLFAFALGRAHAEQVRADGLHRAAARGDAEAVARLLRELAPVVAHAIDPASSCRPGASGLLDGGPVNALSTDGLTPLHLAASSGADRVVRELIRAHAEVSLAARDTGATPLMLSAEKGNDKVLRLLLTNGAGEAVQRILILQNLTAKTRMDYRTILLLLVSAPCLSLAATLPQERPFVSTTTVTLKQDVPPADRGPCTPQNGSCSSEALFEDSASPPATWTYVDIIFDLLGFGAVDFAAFGIAGLLVSLRPLVRCACGMKRSHQA